MGALGFGARYFSQAFYSAQKEKLGVALTLVSIAFAIIGYVLFGCGIYGSYHAFSAQFTL